MTGMKSPKLFALDAEIFSRPGKRENWDSGLSVCNVGLGFGVCGSGFRV